MSYYEKVFLSGSKLPITYHDDEDTRNSYVGFPLHWHEHIEILYLSKGEGTVYVNNAPVNVKEGEIIIINSNTLHAMPSKSPDCYFHCIILNKLFVDNILADKDICFKEHVTEKQVVSLYKSIMEEMTERRVFFESQAAAYCSLLLGQLARNFAYPDHDTVFIIKSPKLKLVKKAMAFIMTSYKNDSSVELIAKHIGCSKYYLCHIFKEITGQTIVDYINVLRCNQIKRLITTENYSIKEAAFSCGFHNLPYFTKIYKKHMGVLPSQEQKGH